MDLKSKCPQCNNIQVIEILPSNVGNYIRFEQGTL